MRFLPALFLACLVCGQAARAAPGDPMPADRVVHAGDTRLDAVERGARLRSDALRAAWLNSGQSLPRDDTAPAITAGEVLTPIVNIGKAPAAPAIDLRFSTGPAGISSIDVLMYAPVGNQHIDLHYERNTLAPPRQAGHVVIQSPAGVFTYGERETFGPYTKAGKWTVEYITITDTAGNSRIYFPSDLAAIFKSTVVQVINPYSDDTPPVATSGRVLTPTISLKSRRPIFAAQLSASDDRSGYVVGYVFILPPGGRDGGYGTLTPLSAPMAAGTVTTYMNLQNPFGPLTGTWSIVGYGVCDVPGNCREDYSSTDIRALFGTTTFEVTN